VLRVGTAIRARSLDLGERAFSSDSNLASPSVRGSFVLRDGGHIKGQAVTISDRDRRAHQLSAQRQVRR
jgi:hypothetical protein